MEGYTEVRKRSTKSRYLAVIGLLLLVLFLLPVISYVIGNTTHKTKSETKSNGKSKEEENITLTLPFKKDSGITLYIDTRLLTQNGTIELANYTKTLLITEPNWPFTLVSDGHRVFKIPTVMIGIPLQMSGRNFSSPIETSLVKEGLCLPFEYDVNTKSYLGVTPEVCKDVIVDFKYRDNGILSHGTISLTISNVIYQERIFMVAWSNVGNYTISIPIRELRFCKGYYSPDIKYTTPGTYLVEGYSVEYIGSGIPRNYTRLLLLYKSSDVEGIWSNITSTYQGYVVVVSPLMKNLASIPYITKLQNVKTILINGDKLVVGVEGVEKELRP